MTHHIIIQLATIGAVALLAQWLAWRVNVPSILFLLIAGLVMGPGTGWLDPDRLFGDLLLPMVSLAVAVILFEGALTLKLHEVQEHGKVVRRMISSGMVVTWAVTAFATHYFVAFDWPLAWLFGAIMVVTGPTVIVPMLRAVRPTATVSNILRWEGILIDPIGAILALLTFNVIEATRFSDALGTAGFILMKMIIVGILLGALAGYMLGVVIRRGWIPRYLHNGATLLSVFAVFALADALQAESGLLAVTIMGFSMANMPRLHIEDILDFKESLSVVLISGLFILLSARVDFSQLTALGLGGVWVFLTMQFVARPLKVAVCTVGTELSYRERALLGWIAPRGIVAAAIAAVFSLRLEEQGFEQAALLVPLTFSIIVGTVVWQSFTAATFAKLLDVSEPHPNGALIVGGPTVSIPIAQALAKVGVRVLYADSSWENVSQARMAGLATYFGNPLSEHARVHMDLGGIGRLLAMHVRPDSNALAASGYRDEFGADEVYVLDVANGQLSGRHDMDPRQRGRRLFGDQISYAKLAAMFAKGAEIKQTNLTDEFDFHAFCDRAGDTSQPLFACDPKGRIHAFTNHKPVNPAPGWRILSLTVPAAAR
ncbi:MAG: sodium:proton antiporter [Pseudomonadota bacterium]